MSYEGTGRGSQASNAGRSESRLHGVGGEVFEIGFLFM